MYYVCSDDVVYCADITLFLYATSGGWPVPTGSFSRRFLVIHSLKGHSAPFSMCKLHLHPILHKLNMRNDREKVQFLSDI